MADFMREKDILDEIKKHKEAVAGEGKFGPPSPFADGYRMAHDNIAEVVQVCVPTVDAVEVVRCKDCVHGNKITMEDGKQVEVCCNGFAFECDHVGIAHSPEFFCAEGERK